MSCGYFLEIDITLEIGPEDEAYYHYLIGVIMWFVELGRVDINIKASLLSSYLVPTRESNFQELFHVFAYLKKHMDSEMMFDPSEPEVDLNECPKQD